MTQQPAGQTFKNHSKFVPLYHFVLIPLLGLNLVWSFRRAGLHPGWETIVPALTAVALVLTAWFARVFALAVQDRVIRLEMRLRLRELLPAELAARIPELSIPQLVALRFASDAELPGLARRVLDERLHDRKAIEQMIKEWQGDYHRA